MIKQKVSSVIVATLAALAGAAALLLLLNVKPAPASAAGALIFVAPDGAGSGTQNNPRDLPSALIQAVDGDTLILAQGAYTGTGGTVITLTQSITLCGGWDGAATGPVVRDPEAYPTTLNGEGMRRGAYVSGGITVTLEGFTVTNGIASIKGAGLYANNAHLTLREMTFYSNAISTTVTGYPYGGGAMVEGGTLQVEASTFRANSVWGGTFPTGGGLVISNTLTATVVDSLFRDNDAWHASGLYFWAPDGGDKAPLTVRGSRFVDNGRGNSPGFASGGYHGAMQIINANARVEDNLVEHNKFCNGRGAVAVYYSDLLMARNIISGNTSHYASGLYLYYLSSPFTLTNNVIVDNQSTYHLMESPCVHIRYSDGQLLHNTIARNDSTYGIKVETGATITLTNTILVSHTVGITVTAGSTATLEATLWGSGEWANGADWGGDGDIFTGTVNVWTDPLFVDPDGGDYHLGAGSPAIDAGVDAGVSTDIDGDPRPLGDGYDIGADEFAWRYIYLPLVLNEY